VPLALRHHATTWYVTNVVEERLAATGAPYDGIAELQWASRAEMTERLYLTPEGQAEVEADIPRFLGTIHAYVVSEHVARW
jgi:hypothetical protein